MKAQAASPPFDRRFGAARVKGVPILDPPTVSSRNQIIREDQPYYIVAGFVKLFPLGLGDFWAHLQQRQEETRKPLSFWEWIKHMLFRSDGRFQSQPRFYFFALNTALRNKALRARGYFLKRQQTASSNNVAYTTEELFKMGKAQFTKIVSAFEHSMAGSAQEKLRQRSDLEAMVEQIEQETLEEQGHALLSAWNTAVSVADILQDKGFLKASRHVKSICDAAKPAIDKVLSPETIAVAPKPTIKSVDPPPIPYPQGCHHQRRIQQYHQSSVQSLFGRPSTCAGTAKLDRPLRVSLRTAKLHRLLRVSLRTAKLHRPLRVSLRTGKHRPLRVSLRTGKTLYRPLRVPLRATNLRQQVMKTKPAISGRFKLWSRSCNNAICASKEEEKYHVTLPL